MRLILAILICIVVPGYAQVCGQESTKGKKPDFSGKWKVDPKKSTVMLGMRAEKITGAIAKEKNINAENVSFPILYVEHKDPEIKITEKSDGADHVYSEEIFYTDGRGESNNNLTDQGYFSTTKWDGKRLVSKIFRMSTSGKRSDTIIARITLELSKDGKTLTKTREPLDPEGGSQANTKVIYNVMTSKWVFHRATD